mmetsp:Transcript_16687/g.42682  ORF Transcript_16687/g.42682 Transcript_16687/m.42682 type:complete len:266 (+) Transcript_16687:82-879(+)
MLHNVEETCSAAEEESNTTESESPVDVLDDRTADRSQHECSESVALPAGQVDVAIRRFHLDALDDDTGPHEEETTRKEESSGSFGTSMIQHLVRLKQSFVDQADRIISTCWDRFECACRVRQTSDHTETVGSWGDGLEAHTDVSGVALREEIAQLVVEQSTLQILQCPACALLGGRRLVGAVEVAVGQIDKSMGEVCCALGEPAVEQLWGVEHRFEGAWTRDQRRGESVRSQCSFGSNLLAVTVRCTKRIVMSGRLIEQKRRNRM